MHEAKPNAVLESTELRGYALAERAFSFLERHFYSSIISI